jgi:hypothetical protein
VPVTAVASPAPPPHSRDLGTVTRDVAGAGDAQVIRIVATVDAMAIRGAADELIAPLRERLAVLRPPRPLRFTRLLFHPLDPVIVAAALWRPGQDGIPRTALAPLADCVRRAIGAQAQAIDVAIRGHTTSETALVAAQGPALWSAAGAILASAAMPPLWRETGLGDAAFAPLARRAGALLAQMPALHRLCAETVYGLLPPRPEALQAILQDVSAADGAALPMLVRLLLTRLPQLASMLAMPSGAAGPKLKVALDQAVDGLLDQLTAQDGAQAQIANASLAEASVAVRRIATLLQQIEDGTVRSARRTQLVAIRQQVDAGCRARFATGLQDQVLTRLHLATGQDMPALEAAARGLRALETEARTMGGSSAYDRMLSQAAEAIKAENGLDRTDQLRLVEILAGSDAALVMLDGRLGERSA